MAVYGIIGGEKYVELGNRQSVTKCSVFSVVNASINNNARERKIVTLNIIILSRPVRTVAVIFFSCS